MVPSAMHGILQSRAHRTAARRGGVLSDDFFGKDYRPAGEPNPTPPVGESAHVVLIPQPILLELTWADFRVGGVEVRLVVSWIAETAPLRLSV